MTTRAFCESGGGQKGAHAAFLRASGTVRPRITGWARLLGIFNAIAPAASAALTALDEDHAQARHWEGRRAPSANRLGVIRPDPGRPFRTGREAPYGAGSVSFRGR